MADNGPTRKRKRGTQGPQSQSRVQDKDLAMECIIISSDSESICIPPSLQDQQSRRRLPSNSDVVACAEKVLADMKSRETEATTALQDLEHQLSVAKTKLAEAVASREEAEKRLQAAKGRVITNRNNYSPSEKYETIDRRELTTLC